MLEIGERENGVDTCFKSCVETKLRGE